MATHVLFLVLLWMLLFTESKKVLKEKVHKTRTRDDRATDESSSVGSHDLKHFSLIIDHAFGIESFSRRGTLQLKSLKSSRDVTLHQESLSGYQLKQLQRAAATSNGLYFIRTSTQLSATDEEESSLAENRTTVTTFMSACALMKSDFSDRIVITGDGKGNIIGLTLLPSRSVLDDTRDCSTMKVSPNGASFTTTISYSTGETGPVPETQGFLQKVEVEKAKKDTEDNRSFFQKYWLYIIIGFVAFQLLAGGGAGGGARGGGDGGGAGQ